MFIELNIIVLVLARWLRIAKQNFKKDGQTSLLFIFLILLFLFFLHLLCGVLLEYWLLQEACSILGYGGYSFSFEGSFYRGHLEIVSLGLNSLRSDAADIVVLQIRNTTHVWLGLAVEVVANFLEVA